MSMNCKDIQNKLLFYLDNELTLKEKQVIEFHLTGCAACRKELEALSKTQDLLSQGFEKLSSKTAPLWSWVELEQRITRLNKEAASRTRSITTGVKSFISWQPSWKPVISGLLAVALITSSIVFIPRLMAPPPEVQASEIAADTPEIVALTAGEPSATETKVSGTTGYVLSLSTSGESNLAYVDLQRSSVTRLFIISVPPLTEDDKTLAASIAKTDPNAGKILENGGIISDLFPLPPRLRLDVVNGQPVIWTEGVMVGAVLRVNNLMWLARIDLGEGKVMDVSMVAPPIPTRHTESVAPYTKEELVEMAKSDSRVSALLEQSAEVVHVAIGRGKMASNGAIILKLGDEVWSVRIDLNTKTVTRFEPVPKAKHGKSNVFSTS